MSVYSRSGPRPAFFSKDSGMKVIVCTDLEGVSGVVSFGEQADSNGKYYEQAKRLLTGEVNAAVEGILDENVEEILVFDGHGCGAITLEELHPRALLAHGRPWPWNHFRNEVIKKYHVTIMIGQHAMAGAECGTLNHTQDSRSVDYYKLNGKPIGEIAQWALCCGAYGIPMIFLSGDDCACREAEDLIPGITTATVKIGLGRQAAISCPPAESHRRIREGIRQAIQRHRQKPLNPLKWKAPYVLEKRFFHNDRVEGYASNPLARIIAPQVVQLRSRNILDIIYA